MITNKRYLGFRNERQEKQNRWLTILASAIITIVIIAVTAGPSLVRMVSDASTETPADVGEPPATQNRN